MFLFYAPGRFGLRFQIQSALKSEHCAGRVTETRTRAGDEKRPSTDCPNNQEARQTRLSGGNPRDLLHVGTAGVLRHFIPPALSRSAISAPLAVW